MIASRLAGLLLPLLAALGSPAMAAPELTLQIDNREVHADLPFTLSLQARGFEEDPQPEPPELEIAGARVTFLGVTPNVSRQITIINGRRTERHDVTFVYQWRVLAQRAGTYEVPALHLSQGALAASSRPARFTVTDISASRDMSVRLELPDRPVWLGETFEVEIEWLLSKDVESYDFVVPLFDLDSVRVEAPNVGQRTVEFPVGGRTVALPMVRDDVSRGGTRYARFRFPALVTVNRPGSLDLDPVRVVARLESGAYRDRFGFRRTRTQLFKAAGTRNRLVVRPLPLADRPAGYVNAIGTSFSIEVDASRTVVQIGDPIELTIRIRGDGELEGLSPPGIGGPAGLPPTLFSVLSEADVGIIDEESNSKTFSATVRVLTAEVREIPPVGFAYFDPVKGRYATVESRPIALSVGGTSVVGAEDVAPAPRAMQAAGVRDEGSKSAPVAVLTTLIGADMALSAEADSLAESPRLADVRGLLVGLYGVPIALAVVLALLANTRSTRLQRRQIDRAARAVDSIAKRGGPAREAGPALLAAVRSLARLTGQERRLPSDLVARLENSSYDPAAGDRPLDADLIAAVSALVEEFRDGATEAPSVTAAAAVMLVALLLVVSTSAPLVGAAIDGAQHESESALEAARTVYAAALDERDRVRRTRLFVEAEVAFRRLAAGLPNAAGLQADWGNAALGAQDIGHAVLAYRRALAIDPSEERAAKNLAWLRERFPVWLPRPEGGGALNTLLFWERSSSTADRYLLGAVAFAVAVLLVLPWPLEAADRYRRGRRRAAIPIAALWIAATASAWFGDDGADDAVIVGDGAALRSADSLGAPLAFANPLPAGTEVDVLESRDAWMRVALEDGSRGWVAAAAVARIEPSP